MNYYKPARFVIVATSYSGGALLCNCLDSHPQVACERDSPLDEQSPWSMWLEAQEEDVLHALWSRPGYRAAGFKLSYRQARRIGPEWLAGEVNGRVIHLHRENVLRQTVSSSINTAVRDGRLQHPHHAFEQPEVVSIAIEPAWFVEECHRLEMDAAVMLAELVELCEDRMLAFTYADLTRGEGNEIDGLPDNVAWALCGWLGVSHLPLVTSTRRVNPQPLSEIVENWDDVLEAVKKDGEFKEYLEEA